MTIMAMTGPGPSQEPEAPFRPPAWVEGAQALGSSCVAFPGISVVSQIGSVAAGK